MQAGFTHGLLFFNGHAFMLLLDLVVSARLELVEQLSVSSHRELRQLLIRKQSAMLRPSQPAQSPYSRLLINRGTRQRDLPGHSGSDHRIDRLCVSISIYVCMYMELQVTFKLEPDGRKLT